MLCLPGVAEGLNIASRDDLCQIRPMSQNYRYLGISVVATRDKITLLNPS